MLLFKVQAKTLLLVLAVLKLGEVDSKIVLLKLMLAPKPDLVELLHVVAPLVLNDIVCSLHVRRLDHFAIFVDEISALL